MKRNHSDEVGFTLVEIMIVVAIIGMLASIAIPNYMHARDKSRMTVCISNLHQIDGAISSWALEAGKQSGQPVQYSDISSYLNRKVVCPAGGTTFDDSYQLSVVDAHPVCLRVTSGQYPHRLDL